MLFDLEIQPNLVDIVYIKQGQNIHNSLVPVSYCNIARRNLVPYDLIEIEEDSRFTSFASAKIETFPQGSKEFSVQSDKFLMSHVKKYSEETGSDVPLFYKHTIPFTSTTKIPVDSIRIYDSEGVTIGLDQFDVQYFENYLCVYINPREGHVLSVEYSVNDGIKSELLKLEQIFKQVEWDFMITREDLVGFEYLYFDKKVMTKYIGEKYFIYQKDVAVFKNPIAGMNDSWYLRIKNFSFFQDGQSYYMPEYNLQQLNYGLSTKHYSKISAKILGNRFVQLQEAVSKDDQRYVRIYIYNSQLDAMEFIFSADSQMVGTVDPLTGLRWIAMHDWNTDGIFELPVTLTTEHIATSDFQTPNEYYELRTLDLNSVDINSSKTVGIYILPASELDNSTMAILYGYVGVYDNNVSFDRAKTSGSGYRDKVEYRSTIALLNGIHLAYVSLSTAKMIDITEFYDSRDFNGGILDRVDISKTDYDIFISDLLDGEIIIPVGDTVVASVDTNVLAVQRNSKEKIELVNDKNDRYIDFIKTTLFKNLDVSTDVIIKN
jgi:hypothetical protein